MFALILTLVFSISGNEGVGTTAFPILKIGYGPRACAMGETFVALANDVTALWWNPAGLGKVDSAEVFFCHQEWFAGIRDEYVGATFINPYGRFAASLLYSGTQDIDVYTGPWQEGKSINIYSCILFLSHGRKINDKLSIGTTLKGAYEDLKEIQGKAFCLDLGALYSPSKRWIFGLNLQNIGPSARYGENKYRLPFNFRVGVCNKLLNNVNIVCDLNLPNDNTGEYHIGAETWLKGMLALRAGYRGAPEGGITAGMGINWKRWGVDYAFVPYGELGNTHRLSLKMSLPGVRREAWLLIKVIDNETGDPLAANLKISGPFEINTITDSKSGEYKMHNPGTGEVEIAVYKEGYHPQNESLYIHKDKNLKHTFRLAKEKDFYLFRYGEKIVIRDINFEIGKATLLPGACALLDSVGEFLLKNLELTIEIAGHTDLRRISTPEFPSNMALSISRAEVAREYLIKNFKIEESRLVARGYGDTRFIASNDTEEGMAKNRRIEFKIIDKQVTE